jgi:hypothetical protein
MQSIDLPVGRFPLWFGLVGGGIAWALHLMLAYGIAEFGCVSPLKETSWLGVSAVAWMLIALSAAMLALALATLFVNYTSIARLAADAHASAHLLARLGLLANLVFASIIVVESIPIFYYLQTC